MSLTVPKQQSLPGMTAKAMESAPTASATGNPRNKVSLKPGRSLMDWIRLGKGGKDLTGVQGRVLKVDLAELAQHNTEEDAWIALHGSVYNITPYMEYHPGGIPELMRGAGMDATELFEEVHKWVNAESMLAKCYVGRLMQEPKNKRSNVKESISSKKNLLLASSSASSLAANGFAKPEPPPPLPESPSASSSPRYDWLQTATTVTVVVYTKWSDMRTENVIIDRADRSLTLTVLIQDHSYLICCDLEGDVTSDYKVQVGKPSGKVEVTLEKVSVGKRWSSLGAPRRGNKSFTKTADTEIIYRPCELLSVEPVTHDTNLYCFGLPEGCRMCIPVGHHVYCKAMVSGIEVVRSYTVIPPSLSVEKQDQRVNKGRVFYLMVKIYNDGAFTPLLQDMKIGEKLEVSSHDGDFSSHKLDACSHLVMYAAGTGFTPMAGLIQAALLHPKPDRKILLVFFNKTKKDILWLEQIKELEDTCDTLEVKHVLSQAEDKWMGHTGRIRKELVEGIIPTPSNMASILFCACGPTAFTKEAIRLAKECGYTEDMVHAFMA